MVSREIVDEILDIAIWLGVSDVHFDPVGDEIRVRFRVHGKLVDAYQVSHIPERVSRFSVQRLKVLSKLSLGEQRRAQDGQMHVDSIYGACDIRIATMPTIRGERLVARVVPQKIIWDQVGKLGLTAVQEQVVEKTLSVPDGLIISGGKVGAGKSTTIHAFLAEWYRRGQDILTIEDPVERKIEGYQQVEVDERMGLSFSDALRASLRQDPDVLMIGEIRDAPTAQVAVRAGMTGHRIITSVHADSAGQVVLRLLELGVLPRYIHDVLRLVTWQTLKPVYCEQCRGHGCGDCLGLGVVGRRAEFEVLTSEQIGDIVFQLRKSRTATFGVHHTPDNFGTSVIRRSSPQLYLLNDSFHDRAHLLNGGTTVAEQADPPGTGY